MSLPAERRTLCAGQNAQHSINAEDQLPHSSAIVAQELTRRSTHRGSADATRAKSASVERGIVWRVIHR
jgi:hypothetical protein